MGVRRIPRVEVLSGDELPLRSSCDSHPCLRSLGSIDVSEYWTPAYADDPTAEEAETHLRVLAARFARALPSFTPFNQEGAGNAGRRLAPAVSCAMSAEDAHTSIQVQPEQPGIPCAMGLRLIPCSPWRRIPLASIAGGLKVLAKPGWISQNLRRLDASNGRQNHTALPSATFAVRRRAAFAHEQAHPAKTCCAPGVPRPPLPAPNVRDDRDTPLLWARDGGVVGVIWVEREAEYF